MKQNKELSERIEYKYYIPLSIRQHLLHDLKKFTKNDFYSNNKDEGYRVASIYYENHTLKSYHDKLEGQAKRVKLRLRFYPPIMEGHFGNIEFKYKVFDKILKRKTKISYNELKLICTNNDFFYEDVLQSSEPLHILKVRHLHDFQAFIRIDYSRRAFFATIDKNIRMTLDCDIKCCRFNGNLNQTFHVQVLSRDIAILEIKTPGYFPFWLSYIIKKYSLKRTAISKYSLSVQNLSVNSSLNIN